MKDVYSALIGKVVKIEYKREYKRHNEIGLLIAEDKDFMRIDKYLSYKEFNGNFEKLSEVKDTCAQSKDLVGKVAKANEELVKFYKSVNQKHFYKKLISFFNMKEFIQKFTDEDVGNIVKLHKSYYLVNKELTKIMNEISDEPQSVGVYLGEDEKPSLALLDILAKKSGRKLIVNEKGEFLFICGRDLMGKSIKSSNVDKGLVLVQNGKDENLGYGKIVGDLSQKEEIVVKNLLDRGDFLRREK